MKTKKIKVLEKPTGTTISNNHIEVKVWDDKAIEAITIVSKAILNMTDLFKSQNINITGISIGDDKECGG